MKSRKVKKPKPDKNRNKAGFIGRFDKVNRFKHWWLGGVSLSRGLFRVSAAWQTLGLLIGMLTVGYVMAAFYTGSGEFVISLDKPMASDGFVISDTKDFKKQLVTLHGDAVSDADNISIYDIDKNVAKKDGPHNGINYVAYTFYIKNATGEKKSYRYQIQIKATKKGAENATWIMVFKNNKQQIYAKKAANGKPECQYSYSDFPFTEYALNPEKQVSILTDEKPGYITDSVKKNFGLDSVKGLYQLETKPFESDDCVCTGTTDGMNDGDIDQYTVVIWLEGEDPECVDDILGGYVELAMKLSY